MGAQVLVFALFGAATGSVYALSSVGIVLVYRGSGVLNLSSGAVGMFSAYVYNDLRFQDHAPDAPAFVAALTLCAVLGYVTHLLIARRAISNLTRIVATLSVLIVVEGIIELNFLHAPLNVPGVIPSTPVVFGSIGIGSDRIVLIGIALALSGLASVGFRYSRVGLAITAVAENEKALASLGWNSEVIAATAWIAGSVLAGMAGILLAPIFGLSVELATLLLLPSLAAAVVGKLVSFPLALLGAMGIGIMQSELERWADSAAWLGDALPYGIVILLVAFRGSAIPLRNFVVERLPRITNGRPRPTYLAVGFVLMTVAIFVAHLPETWLTAISVALAFAVILEGVVVMTGFAGQVSLAQWVVAGVGALIFSRFVAFGMPFEVAIPLTVAVAVPLGMAMGLLGLRARGMVLAVATFALAVLLVSVVLGSQTLTGGSFGLTLPTFRLFGIALDSQTHLARYSEFELVVVVAVALVVLSLRRGRTGRRLAAVRSNERAARATGISVTGAKAAAFAYGSTLAVLGGILVVLPDRNPDFAAFDVMTSLLMLGYAVIGGVGTVLGPFVGAQFVGTFGDQSGGVGARVLELVGSRAGAYLTLLTGIVLLVVTVCAPDGLAMLPARLRRWSSSAPGRTPERRTVSIPEVPPIALLPACLEVRGIGVNFGAVAAVAGVSFTLRSGEILGVIGPNGSGKSVLIDSISGFVAPSNGSVVLDGDDITALAPHRRSGRGLVRTFQSLELFEDLTVRENLLVAGDNWAASAYLRDAVHPGPAMLSDAALAAVAHLGLADVLDELPSGVAFGTRRLVALARALASAPRVLLLDEPAASLDDRERHELGLTIRSFASDWGMAVLLVEHDVDLVASVSDRMLALDFGRVVAEGAPDLVRLDVAVARSYLGVDVTNPM